MFKFSLGKANQGVSGMNGSGFRAVGSPSRQRRRVCREAARKATAEQVVAASRENIDKMSVTEKEVQT